MAISHSADVIDICRYLEVFHWSTAKVTTRAAVFTICVIWLFPVVVFVPWVFVYGERTFPVDGGRYEFVACHAEWPSQWMFRAFTVGVVFFTCYLLPLLCIGVFYALIAARVWRRRVSNLAVQSRAAANIRRSKIRLLRMLVTVVVLFATSWLPLYVINLRRVFNAAPAAGSPEKRLIDSYLGPLAQWLGASNSCVNPFVYCYFSHAFRSGVAALLRAVFCRSSSSVSQSTTLELGQQQRHLQPAAAAAAAATADVDVMVTSGRRCRDDGEDEIEVIALSSRTTQDIQAGLL